MFGASVNDDLFLNDPTGNRRFWTIPVQSMTLDHGIDMQQLWAEVLMAWQLGENWFMTRDEVAELNVHNEDFTAAEPVDERIAAMLDWGRGDLVWLTATEVLLRVGVTNPTKTQTISAARVLKKLNGGQRRKSNGKVVFAVPAENFLG